jgi:hypothetical protein
MMLIRAEDLFPNISKSNAVIAYIILIIFIVIIGNLISCYS